MEMTLTEKAKQFIQAHEELSLFRWDQHSKEWKIKWIDSFSKGEEEAPFFTEVKRIINSKKE